jgi:hypothetical protein
MMACFGVKRVMRYTVVDCVVDSNCDASFCGQVKLG